MSPITLELAHALLSEASAVIVDGNAVTYPRLEDLTGEPDNEWLDASWTDGEGDEYREVFDERANPMIKDGNLRMTNTRGQKTSFEIMTHRHFADDGQEIPSNAHADALAALREILGQIDQGGSGGKVFARDACIARARSVLAAAQPAKA